MVSSPGISKVPLPLCVRRFPPASKKNAHTTAALSRHEPESESQKYNGSPDNSATVTSGICCPMLSAIVIIYQSVADIHRFFPIFTIVEISRSNRISLLVPARSMPSDQEVVLSTNSSGTTLRLDRFPCWCIQILNGMSWQPKRSGAEPPFVFRQKQKGGSTSLAMTVSTRLVYLDRGTALVTGRCRLYFAKNETQAHEGAGPKIRHPQRWNFGDHTKICRGDFCLHHIGPCRTSQIKRHKRAIPLALNSLA